MQQPVICRTSNCYGRMWLRSEPVACLRSAFLHTLLLQSSAHNHAVPAALVCRAGMPARQVVDPTQVVKCIHNLGPCHDMEIETC